MGRKTREIRSRACARRARGTTRRINIEMRARSASSSLARASATTSRTRCGTSCVAFYDACAKTRPRPRWRRSMSANGTSRSRRRRDRNRNRVSRNLNDGPRTRAKTRTRPISPRTIARIYLDRRPRLARDRPAWTPSNGYSPRRRDVPPSSTSVRTTSRGAKKRRGMPKRAPKRSARVETH